MDIQTSKTPLSEFERQIINKRTKDLDSKKRDYETQIRKKGIMGIHLFGVLSLLLTLLQLGVPDWLLLCFSIFEGIPLLVKGDSFLFRIVVAIGYYFYSNKKGYTISNIEDKYTELSPSQKLSIATEYAKETFSTTIKDIDDRLAKTEQALIKLATSNLNGTPEVKRLIETLAKQKTDIKELQADAREANRFFLEEVRTAEREFKEADELHAIVDGLSLADNNEIFIFNYQARLNDIQVKCLQVTSMVRELGIRSATVSPEVKELSYEHA